MGPKKEKKIKNLIKFQKKKEYRLWGWVGGKGIIFKNFPQKLDPKDN